MYNCAQLRAVGARSSRPCRIRLSDTLRALCAVFGPANFGKIKNWLKNDQNVCFLKNCPLCPHFSETRVLDGRILWAVVARKLPALYTFSS